MHKKSTKEILKFYSRKATVESYDRRRFRGKGGEYINKQEILPILELLDLNLNSKKGIKILDLGAGRGRLSLPLKKEGYDVYCLDSSPEMIKILKKNFSASKIFEQSIFNSLKTKEKFDAIVALRFFDHFSINDHKKILLNISKNLNKSGFIIFTSVNKNSLESWMSRLFPYGRYNYFYTDLEYRKLFTSANLKVINFLTYFFHPRGAFLYLQKIPFWITPFILLDKLITKIFSKSGAYVVYLLKKAS